MPKFYVETQHLAVVISAPTAKDACKRVLSHFDPRFQVGDFIFANEKGFGSSYCTETGYDCNSLKQAIDDESSGRSSV